MYLAWCCGSKYGFLIRQYLCFDCRYLKVRKQWHINIYLLIEEIIASCCGFALLKHFVIRGCSLSVQVFVCATILWWVVWIDDGPTNCTPLYICNAIHICGNDNIAIAGNTLVKCDVSTVLVRFPAFKCFDILYCCQQMGTIGGSAVNSSCIYISNKPNIIIPLHRSSWSRTVIFHCPFYSEFFTALCFWTIKSVYVKIGKGADCKRKCVAWNFLTFITCNYLPFVCVTVLTEVLRCVS